MCESQRKQERKMAEHQNEEKKFSAVNPPSEGRVTVVRIEGTDKKENKKIQDEAQQQPELLIKPPVMRVQEILPELPSETPHAVKWRLVL